jgi:Leucine-rich repeat (LRR) protein
LETLRSLSLSDNNLNDASFPGELATMTALTALDVSANNLTTVPIFLAALSLERLLISGNALAELTALAFRDSLLFLDVRDNALTALPPSMDSFSQLQSLHLSGNAELSFEPNSSAFSLMPQLTRLSLARLGLKNLPALPPTLRHLDASSNRLSVFPGDFALVQQALVSLDASHNVLVVLPPELENLPFLQTLNLRHNPMCADTGFASWAPSTVKTMLRQTQACGV